MKRKLWIEGPFFEPMISNFCSVAISPNEVLFIAGTNRETGTTSEKTFFFDFTSGLWVPFPSLTQYLNSWVGCSATLAFKKDGSRFVVLLLETGPKFLKIFFMRKNFFSLNYLENIGSLPKDDEKSQLILTYNFEMFDSGTWDRKNSLAIDKFTHGKF